MKLVKEHINEVFTPDSDPIDDLGIGIRKKIEQWLLEPRHRGIQNPKIVRDSKTGKLLINAGHVDLSHREVTTLPWYINFGKVDYFSCYLYYKKNLKQLPKHVKGNLRFWNSPGKKYEYTEKDVRKVCKVDGEIQYFTD